MSEKNRKRDLRRAEDWIDAATAAEDEDGWNKSTDGVKTEKLGQHKNVN